MSTSRTRRGQQPTASKVSYSLGKTPLSDGNVDSTLGMDKTNTDPLTQNTEGSTATTHTNANSNLQDQTTTLQNDMNMDLDLDTNPSEVQNNLIGSKDGSKNTSGTEDQQKAQQDNQLMAELASLLESTAKATLYRNHERDSGLDLSKASLPLERPSSSSPPPPSNLHPLNPSVSLESTTDATISTTSTAVTSSSKLHPSKPTASTSSVDTLSKPSVPALDHFGKDLPVDVDVDMPLKRYDDLGFLIDEQQQQQQQQQIQQQRQEDVEEIEDENDPFGFGLVEKRLDSTRALRPIPVALNKQQHNLRRRGLMGGLVEEEQLLESVLSKQTQHQPPQQHTDSEEPEVAEVPRTRRGQRPTSSRLSTLPLKRALSSSGSAMEGVETDNTKNAENGEEESHESFDTDRLVPTVASATATTPAIKKSKLSSRYSMGLDEFPLVMPKLPKRIPEAGYKMSRLSMMRNAQESSGRSSDHGWLLDEEEDLSAVMSLGGGSSRNSRTSQKSNAAATKGDTTVGRMPKVKSVSQLEAMLPKRASKKSTKSRVMVESDIESDSDEEQVEGDDDKNDSGAEEGEGGDSEVTSSANDEDDDEDELYEFDGEVSGPKHQRRGRSSTSKSKSATATSASSGKRSRTAVAAAQVQKAAVANEASSSKSKGKSVKKQQQPPASPPMSEEYLALQKERIAYFREVDEFELAEETV